jgi:hypothetical protein
VRKLLSIAAFAFALLIMPAVALAQPPGCLWQGDPAMRYGFGQYDGLPYNQPGNDFANIYPGATLTYTLAPFNCNTVYLPTGICKALDTLCFHAVSLRGWTITCDPPMGDLYELYPGYIWYQDISITAPCDANIGEKDTVIAQACYANIAGVCAPECGDCADPNTRPATGVKYYNADTLIVTVVARPPALGVLQDTLSLIGQGQPQANVPFSICNENECAPPAAFNYNIKSRGHVGGAINTTGTVTVDGGACKDVYGVINAGTAMACAYDTLTIVAWSADEPVIYDTCVQVVHVIAPLCGTCTPVLTPAVSAILVLVLVLVAAVFLRRRAAKTV